MVVVESSELHWRSGDLFIYPMLSEGKKLAKKSKWQEIVSER
jgi:hypothetical protein